jgi:hypothetical protein
VKTSQELERDIAQTLARPVEPRQTAALSSFHRTNIPAHHWEDLIAPGVVVRKVGRATKVTDGGLTTYYYRGVSIDQDLSVPSGYYGRWRARGITDDSLKAVLAAIDAAGAEMRTSHALLKSKPSSKPLFKKEPGGYTTDWNGHTYHVFRAHSEYGDFQWIVDRDDRSSYAQTDTLREAKDTIADADD